MNPESDNKLLTALELKVMNQLWDMGEAFVKELVEKWEDHPRPAYNTLSTIVRILEEKGYVDHKPCGRSFCYFPVISRARYRKNLLQNVIQTAFSGSVSSLISTIVNDKTDLSPQELDELKALIDKYDGQ